MNGTELGVAPSVVLAPPETLTPQKLLSLGVLSPAMVDRTCADERQAQFLIDGLLSSKGIGILAGDSAIGKSPLAYQLALCVAAGVPFLGMKTRQGRVLHFDLENPLADCKTIRDVQVRFLGLQEAPEGYLLVPEPLEDLERLMAEIRPQLVLLDSLRSYRPEVTRDNPTAGEWLKAMHRLARKYGCAILFVHHLRKPDRPSSGRSSLPKLENCNVVTWLLETEGPRALVNQTDVRIAVAEGDMNPAALRIKWSLRVHGDSPLVLLERVFDEDNEPIGYRRLGGAGWLSPERREAYEKLPPEFAFKDAKAALNRSDDPTNKFLHECRHLGVLEKIGTGRYKKLVPKIGQARDGQKVAA